MEKINEIYIIDDDPIIVFGVQKILSSIIDCENINSFGNGKLAIDSIKKAMELDSPIPQVIFLDINMPIMDGWQFLEEFVKLPLEKKVRVNILTSSIDAADREKWLLYKSKTHHLITYNNKPAKREHLIEITKPA